MQTIQAQPGWNVVTPRSMNANRLTGAGIFREPIIAWQLDSDKGQTTVLPMTIQGTLSSPDIVFQRPNRTYILPGVDEWGDDSALFDYFKCVLEAEDA